MYTGPVEPGSTHDLTAARLHVLPALYRSAWPAMPVLADKGYQDVRLEEDDRVREIVPLLSERIHSRPSV